jgi:apolipoprotein N-acyltransferase
VIGIRGLAAGLLLAASLPPWGWWPLGLAGAAMLFAAVEGWAWRGRLAAGLAAGLGLYGPGLWWLTEFHAVGYMAVVALESALLAGVLAVGVPARPRPLAALAFPAALVVAEAVRGRWPFGGLPLGGIDLGQVGGPLLPAARAGGHLLLVALVGVAGVGLAAAVRAVRRDGGWRGPAAVAAGCLGGVAAVSMLGVVAPDGRAQGSLAAAAVQGGGPRGLRAVVADEQAVFDRHVAATAGVRTPVDLVLWPEDVVDVDGALAGSGEERALSGLARALGTTLVAGVVEDEAGRRFRNAAVAWGPDGSVVDRYDKVHRVPFGEYIPFRSLIGRLADVSAVPRDAVAGRGPGVLDTPAGRLGVVISYEVFFAHRARAAVAAGGRVLLVPTNASSYTTSQVPTQEVAVARLRAVETGRWALQAAPTGYSAVVDHRGRVHQRGPLGEAAVLHAEVGLRSGTTWAVAIGDLPVVLAAAAVAAAAVLRSRKVE